MGQNKVFNYIKSNLHLSSGTLAERIVSQKTMYILQKAGISLGYSFNWYLYGVYSQELADDFFSYEEGPEEIESSKKEIIEKFKSLLGEHIQDPIFLEMASSIIFIKNRNPFSSKDEIFNKIIEVKPHLNDETLFSEANNMMALLIS